MERLKEIFEDPERRRGKRIKIRAKILGWRYCAGQTFLKTRSDVMIHDGEYCIASSFIPMSLRGKETILEGIVEVRDNKIRLEGVKILEVI